MRISHSDLSTTPGAPRRGEIGPDLSAPPLGSHHHDQCGQYRAHDHENADDLPSPFFMTRHCCPLQERQAKHSKAATQRTAKAAKPPIMVNISSSHSP